MKQPTLRYPVGFRSGSRLWGFVNLPPGTGCEALWSALVLRSACDTIAVGTLHPSVLLSKWVACWVLFGTSRSETAGTRKATSAASFTATMIAGDLGILQGLDGIAT